MVGMLQGQAEYQLTTYEASSIPKTPCKQHGSIHDYSVPQKPTQDDKRLSRYLKSVEMYLFFFLHHGTNQFSELEMETAWDYSFKEVAHKIHLEVMHTKNVMPSEEQFGMLSLL